MRSNLVLTALIFCFCSSSSRAQSSQENAFRFSSVTETKKKDWSKKANVVDIYPNPSTSGTVSVSSKTEQSLHFYIFDLEGTLIYQTLLKTKEKKAINSLTKGTYMYNVFANDESIEEGKLIIK